MMACACGCTAMAQDRLDVVGADGKIKSVMVSNIEQIVYAKGDKATATDGYDQVIIKLKDGNEVVWSMAEYKQIAYKVPTKEWLEIARTNDEHSWVVMYDCINNDGVMDPNKPVDWTAERCGRMPHFNYFAEKGFDPYYTLIGQYTGVDYSKVPDFVFWSEPEDNRLGIASWSFVMPNEPVTIAATSVERTTYDNMDFLGKYVGFPVKVGENRLYTGQEPTFSITFKGNETYNLQSQEENRLSFIDWYDYHADQNTFAYQEMPFDGLHLQDSTMYGATGQFYQKDVLVDVHNLTVNKPENKRYYFGSKDVVNYVCAARDEYGAEYLVEATDSQNNKAWYFLSNYGASKKQATLDFYFGTTIAQQCEAFVSYDGEIQMKYLLEYNAAPQFIVKGKEAGTYTSTVAGQPDLTFDGFGYAKYGERTCNYTMESSVATVKIGEENHMFTLDMEAKTYTEVVCDEWNGPVDFVNDSIEGYVAGEEVSKLNKVYVSLNKNLMGEAKPGFAAISIDLERYGAYINAVADCQRFIYQAEKRTLTITNVLVGMKEGGSARKNLHFQVSEDMQRLYLVGTDEETKVYATSYTGSYAQLNETNALVAPKKEEVALAKKYAGKFDMMYFDQSSGQQADCTLLIDAEDATGKEKAGYAYLLVPFMGSNIIAGCVPYEFVDGTLTLQGMQVGDGNYGVKTADIVFTLAEDGSLTGSGLYNGSDMNSSFMAVDFSSGKFVPVAE